MKFVKKTPRPKALWTRTFPDQAAKLRPEAGPAGGIKARSQSEKVRMDVYRSIALLFKASHPDCEACEIVKNVPRWVSIITPSSTEDIHHKAGRDGYLLFDVRHFMAVCRPCHDWIHTNPAEATRLKLLIKL